MSLDTRTINKLMRENFPGSAPMTVAPGEREQLRAAAEQRLGAIEGIETGGLGHALSDQEKARLVLQFSVNDPARRYWSYRSTFRLALGEDRALTLEQPHSSNRAAVGDLDEVVRFVLHCKQRLARRRALKAKREKVRDLKAQAIVAQVRQLAKEERFDFTTAWDSRKLKLFVKLSDAHCVEMQVPFKSFQETLPHLRSAIAALRQMYGQGIRCKVTGVSWHGGWISHTSL